MRKLISIILLGMVATGLFMSISQIPFGEPGERIGDHFINQGVNETGATNIVAAVVVSYRGFDTLGEVSVLFTAAMGLGAVIGLVRRKKTHTPIEPASLIVYTGCRFLFPVILLVGTYIVIHGHLTPGGGFQGGAVIASAFLLMYLGCRGKRIRENLSRGLESLGGLLFILLGVTGLVIGRDFLFSFLPEGEAGNLISAGIIPLIYMAVGLKVGSELTGIIDHLIEDTDELPE
ncbi:MAG TPA: cation:proton antiporter [Bacteroidetes bacterium]|nr:cation:proton antiporter [Bacteroidota bacterium]